MAQNNLDLYRIAYIFKADCAPVTEEACALDIFASSERPVTETGLSL